MSFNVIVSIGAKKVSINNLKPTDTIADLIQKLKDQEGLDKNEINSLVYLGHPLSDTKKQLKEVGIRARSNLLLTFRVNGGMSQDPGDKASEPTPRTRRFREKLHQLDPMKDGFKVITIKAKNKKCLFCTGCTESQTLTLLTFNQCHNEEHAFCVDCIYDLLDRAIRKNSEKCISCVDSQCKEKFGIISSFNAAALTDEEVEKFETQLNKNCMPFICPNSECQACLSIDDVKTNKVQCRKCKGKWFCKLCTNDWPEDNNDYMVCGYDDCKRKAQILKTLQNCERKDYNFNGCVEKNVPSMRMCKGCELVVAWTEKCKHATCPKCSYKFCFVCLKEGHGCNLNIPCEAKEQILN